MNFPAFESHYTYPGEFVPERDEKKLIRQLKNSRRWLIHPFINISESAALYEVQVSAPGLEREELIVYGNKTSLLVDASAITGSNNNKKNFHSNIKMTSDADTELAVAEYKNSVLHLYVPKTKQPVKQVLTRIVVY